MSSKAEQIKAKTQRIRTSEAAAPEKSAASSSAKPRVKPVRRTVDLSAAHHAELDAWCAETARELGRARVTGQDVLRTLVAELLRDETTARKVRKALKENQ